MWLLINEHGGRIVLAVGPTMPPGYARVDYAVKEQAAVAETHDRHVMFARAARDVVGLAAGEPTRFSEQHLLDAAELIERLG
jgi:hypothetical protein